MNLALRKSMTLAEFLVGRAAAPALRIRRNRRRRHDGGDGAGATVYARSGDAWTHDILIADSILVLPEIGVELPLADLHEGIVFEAEQEGDRRPEGECA